MLKNIEKDLKKTKEVKKKTFRKTPEDLKNLLN